MRKPIFALLTGLFFTMVAHAQYSIELEVFAQGISIPTTIAHAGDDRLFVTEKGGRIRIIMPQGQLVTDPYLDIRDRVRSSGGEQGLLGLAFHPDYLFNGHFFVNYTRSDGATVVSRFTRNMADPMTADPDSEEIILVIPQPFANHNGGDLHFGPDGFLYISSGDGGSGGDPQDNGQERTTLLGKILRINVSNDLPYTIPVDNPFVGDPATLDEIWALGLRNPWRFSFDRMTGDMWIGDVGQGAWEEIDLEPAGSTGGLNYGWRCYEGNVPFNTNGCGDPSEYTFPVHVYPNNRFGSGCSVTGGYVYRGTEFPAMYGDYLYTDFCSGKFWALTPDTGNTYVNREIGDFQGNEFGAFGQDLDGELYVAALQSGIIYRIQVPCALEYVFVKTDQQCPGTADGTARVDVNGQTGNVQFLWSNGATGPAIDSLLPGVYFVTVSDATCTRVDSVTIQPSTEEACVLGDLETFFCAGGSATLAACAPPTGYTGQWYLNGTPLANETADTLIATQPGEYLYSYEGDCSIPAEGSILVVEVVLEQPVIRLFDSLATIFVGGPAGFSSYIWRVHNQVEQTEEPFLEVFEEGFYTLIVVDSNGCESPPSDSLFVMTGSRADQFSGELEVYPNPASERLYPQWPTLGSGGEWILVRSDGAIVRRDRVDPSDPQNGIDVSGLAKGMYLLRLQVEDGFYIGKFAIE